MEKENNTRECNCTPECDCTSSTDQYTPLTVFVLDVLGMLSNAFMFGVIAYAVFILGFSGWWFALYLASRFWVEWGNRSN